MNIYIVLGILYLAYIIYSRYRQAQANRPKIDQRGAEQGDQNQGSGSLLEQLKKLAEEAAEQQRQKNARSINAGPTNTSGEQEYPDEWVITETGTKVHDLEGRKLKEEYLNSKESERSFEGSLREEYLSSKESARSSETKIVEEYQSAHERGAVPGHNVHAYLTNLKAKTPKRLEARRKKAHPLKKELFNSSSIRKAFILKEVLEKPKEW